MKRQYFRSKSSGRFISRPQAKRLATLASKPNEIVRGRLYEYRGIPVRVNSIYPNQGKVMVSAHKSLTGVVDSDDLRLLPKAKVKKYLTQS